MKHVALLLIGSQCVACGATVARAYYTEPELVRTAADELRRGQALASVRVLDNAGRPGHLTVDGHTRVRDLGRPTDYALVDTLPPDVDPVVVIVHAPVFHRGWTKVFWIGVAVLAGSMTALVAIPADCHGGACGTAAGVAIGGVMLGFISLPISSMAAVAAADQTFHE